jgi:GTPase SAR1 family protein
MVEYFILINSIGVILIFDLTNRNSFEKLQAWLDDILNFGPKDVNIILIGNKSDLADDRTTTFNEAYNFATKNNVQYLEVSAKTGNNVSLLFESLTKIMVKKEQELEKKRKKKGKIDKTHVTTNKSVTLDNSIGQVKEVKKESKCC